MGKSGTRPVKYWGLFVSDFYVTDSSPFDDKPIGRYCQLMAVTSFSKLHNGTVMVHGWIPGEKENSRVSVHRRLEGLYFYATQLAAQQAAAVIQEYDKMNHSVVVAAQERWREAVRIQKRDAMRAAGARAFQPIELESL